ncbi:MAG: hypothetical protein WCZ66_09920 [Sphingomonadaceae bacterium]
MTAKDTLPLNPWIAASIMQKAIRRGEPELAARAAAIYHRLRGKPGRHAIAALTEFLSPGLKGRADSSWLLPTEREGKS